jgi:hypothetical protein
VVREAYRVMSAIAAARAWISVEETNGIVAVMVDIRNRAPHDLKGFISTKKSPHSDDSAVVAV